TSVRAYSPRRRAHALLSVTYLERRAVTVRCAMHERANVLSKRAAVATTWPLGPRISWLRSDSSDWLETSCAALPVHRDARGASSVDRSPRMLMSHGHPTDGLESQRARVPARVGLGLGRWRDLLHVIQELLGHSSWRPPPPTSLTSPREGSRGYRRTLRPLARRTVITLCLTSVQVYGQRRHPNPGRREKGQGGGVAADGEADNRQG